ncbi:MAG: alpha-L-fucosidase, partial [Kiritimatiellia bacterium]
MNNREWFKAAKFGLMVHWGLYCLPAGEWKGRRMPYI